MKESQIDIKLLTTNVSEIHDSIKIITDLFPKEDEIVLKHLAASAIHLTFFLSDLYDAYSGVKTSIEGKEKFLKACGCAAREFKDET